MARKKSKGKSKKCIVQSGPKKGKLKKGWKFGKGGVCRPAKKK